jgi:uncharacterized protein
MARLEEAIRAVLSCFPEVQLCIVFGSAASGTATARSDLDVAISAAGPLAADRRLELIEALSASIDHDIDLVDLMAASGPILRQILSKGVIVQNREKALYARLISRMLLDQADMMPLYDRVLKERRRRFLYG